MKKILTTTIFFLLIFLLHTSTSFAATYYVSNTGLDTNNGTTESTPWQTLSKVNSSTFLPGDSILFKKGDTFYGSITVNQSGTAGNPITFSSYGSGSQPIITGFTDVTSWTNLGNNIWESTNAVSTLSTLNMVTINNVNTAMGRWPNADAGNGGYATLESHSGSTSITDNQLMETPYNWTGADIINKVAFYILNRSTITSHTNGTLTFSPATNYSPKDGWGYFIENSINTLDQQNEWYYNPTTKKISIYSSTQPSSVKIASVSNLFTVHGSYITIDGLSFSGSNNNAIYNQTGDIYRNLIVQDSDIYFSGENGIKLKMLYARILDNTITDSQNNGIHFTQQVNTDNLYITNNTITNSGQLAGMNINNSDGSTLSGIAIANKNYATIQYNTILNSGYNGIGINGSNSIIKNNFIDTFCNILDDGGGIYTYESSNHLITENIVLNGIGQRYGAVTTTYNQAEGIYLDYLTNGHEVSYNTVTSSRIGIFTHGSNLNVHHNTSYNNRTYQMLEYDNVGGVDAVNNLINNNILVSKSTAQKSIEIDYPLGNTSSIGTLDYNYYARPIDDTSTIRVWAIGDSASNYNLAGWQALLGKDTNSKKSPISISSESDIFFDYNTTTSSKTVTLPWPVVDMDGVKHTGNITIDPYSSVIYLKDPNPTPTITTYTLTYTANSNGTILGTTPQTVNSGSSGTAVTAVPSTGYQFTSWSDSSTTNPRTDTNVTSNKTVSATFTLISVTPPVEPVPPSGGGGGGGSSYTPPTTSLTDTQLKAKSKDIKQDGHLNIIDFNIIMANWNKTYTKDISLSKGDMTGDGKIDIFDINQLMVYWDVKY